MKRDRETIVVELVHSMLLAKQLWVEKLQAIRHYYDRYCLPKFDIRPNAFKLLLRQTHTRISEDARVGTMEFHYFRMECSSLRCGTSERIGECCKRLPNMILEIQFTI